MRAPPTDFFSAARCRVTKEISSNREPCVQEGSQSARTEEVRSQPFVLGLELSTSSKD